MRNHSVYLKTMKWFFIIEAICLISGIVLFYPLIIFAITLGILGFVQLVEGVAYTIDMEARPAWFKKGFKIYWLATAIFFLVAALIANDVEMNGQWLFVWLFIVPWFIAIYQYLLIRKLQNYETRKIEDSFWEAEQVEKNLSNSFSDY